MDFFTFTAFKSDHLNIFSLLQLLYFGVKFVLHIPKSIL